MDIPAYYAYNNFYNATASPSTMHAQNTTLKNYFCKYLLEKAISVFEWKLPETWAKNYFLYSLYAWGPVAIVNTDRFGVIPQACGLSGYTVFYQPREAIITNPLIRGTLRPVIGENCTVLHLQPDYSSILDIISYYGDLLAICAETVGTNLFNTKVSYVFTAQNKAAAESFKKMFDKIGSGEPAVFVDTKLLTPDGKPQWQTFAQNLKENYIASDVLDDMQKIIAQFETDIGIPNSNTQKKERLITDEVNSNNISTYSKAALWLESLKEGVEETCDMFGISPDVFSVDWRDDYAEKLSDDYSIIEGGRRPISDDEPTGRDEPRNSR